MICLIDNILQFFTISTYVFEYVTRRDLIMRKIGRLKATNSCENCKELVNSLFKRI